MSAVFTDLALPRPLVAVLTDSRITEPFPIQRDAIPPGLDSRDILGKAPTGSGKTLAFGLPLLSLVSRAAPNRPAALVLAPTRELAEQIRRDLAPLADAVDRRVGAVYGGVGYGGQKSMLRRGTDVLVATPGRLEDLIEQGHVELSEVHIAVVDEADRMADMGFLPAVRRILDGTKPHRQTLLFSATLDREVDVLSRRYQRDPITIAAESTKASHSEAVHRFWRVERSERVSHTARAVDQAGRGIVFTRTRRGADRLSKQLSKTNISAVALHGGRSQNQRTRALDDFSRGKVQALIATDVAARGIHIEDVAIVIHYDLAGDPKDYLHRSGRTARAGATGIVMSFVLPGEESGVRKLQRQLDMRVPIESPQPGPLGGNQHPHPSMRGRGDSGTTARRGSLPTRNGEGRSIFVGNLPWSTTEDELASLFAPHGEVRKTTIVTQRRTGRSKGFGFIEMAEQDCSRAIEALGGTTLGGRRLKVRFATQSRP